MGKRPKDMEIHLTKENIQIENKHMRRRSTPLAIHQMQIKTTMRSQYKPIRMAKIKSSDNTEC